MSLRAPKGRGNLTFVNFLDCFVVTLLAMTVNRPVTKKDHALSRRDQ